MPTPVERIEELQRLIVDEQIRRQKEAINKAEGAEAVLYQMLGSLIDEDLEPEERMKDPWTMIAAIICYLQEREGK